MEVTRNCWKYSCILETPQATAPSGVVGFHDKQEQVVACFEELFSAQNLFSAKESLKPLHESDCIQDFELKTNGCASTPNEALVDIRGEK